MKVISFCIFGTSPTYSVGALRNIDLYSRLLPDYRTLFYVGTSVSAQTRSQILNTGGHIVEMAHPEDWRAALWRLEILKEEGISHILFRDTDSRPMQKEADAVRAWEESGKAFHVMRDHSAHGAVILAGMWGCTQRGARQIRDKIVPLDKLPASTNYDDHLDQGWLERCVWPLAKTQALVHASHWTTFYGPTTPFPSEASEGFIGEAFDHNEGFRYPDHHDQADICRRCSCTLKCPQ